MFVFLFHLSPKNKFFFKNIRRFILLLAVVQLSNSTLSLAQTSYADSLAKIKNEKKELKRKKNTAIFNKDFVNIGVEISQPTFRYGYKANAPFVGPSLIFLGGLFHVNLLQGIAEVQDSGKTFMQRGGSFQAGFNIPLTRIQSPSVHIVPSIGFGFAFQYLDDTRKLTSENESNDADQFGMYIRPAIRVKLGPVGATIAYNVGIAANFSSRNAVNPFTHYPTVGIYLSALPLLMNPRDFTASGQRHYRDLVKTEQVNSGLYYNKEIDRTQDYIKYRKTEIQYVKSTYADRYEVEEIKINDVRPFTYLGPRVSSTLYTGKQFESATNMGLNFGFRYGLWYVNSFVERGDIILKSPTSSEDLRKLYNSSAIPLLSGSFKNSYKMGLQVGIELIAKSIKKSFKARWDQRKDVGAATSYFGIIPYVGYGLASVGAFRYHSATGAEDIQTYATLSKSTVFDYKTLEGQQQFYDFGATIHVGALCFGAEYFLYPDAKKLSGLQYNLGLNVPIFRVARAVLVRRHLKKIKEMAE